jgi:hypothetical protein
MYKNYKHVISFNIINLIKIIISAVNFFIGVINLVSLAIRFKYLKIFKTSKSNLIPHALKVG